MNILVVAAHPDDEVLGCGATIAALAEQGHRIGVAILGHNERVSHNDILNAHQILGIQAMWNCDYPCRKFDDYALLTIVQDLEAVIVHFAPQVIYTHFAGDLNIDHPITLKAVLTAARPMGGSVKKVYSFEVPSSTEWAFGQYNTFKPNVFFEISSENLQKKVAAMKAYTTEIRSEPHPRSELGIIGLAGMRGRTVGVNYAEAFQLIWEVQK
jgi:LmbE family N-acetylglucosaminyl deacetylase